MLKQFFAYKAGSGNSIDKIAAALENLQIQIANIKPKCKPFDTLMAIALMNTTEDPAFNTTKQLLEQEPELTLKATKKALKATEQQLQIEKNNSIENAH